MSSAFSRDSEAVRLPAPEGVDDPLPLSIVAKAALATLLAVCVVHLFAGPLEPLAEFAVHAFLITGAYTVAFALTYLLLQRVRRFRVVKFASLPVFVALFSALACLAGVLLLAGLTQVDEILSGVINVHSDANWLLKLAPVWLVMTVVIFQSERTRVLESELRRLSVSRAKIKMHETDAPYRVAIGSRDVVNISSGKAVHAVRVEDVSHVIAVENYCEVHFTDRAKQKPLLIRATLASLIEQLPKEDFARTHRSHVVNLACVDSIGKAGRAYAAVLSDGRTVSVSRRSIDEVSVRWRDFLRAGPAREIKAP